MKKWYFVFIISLIFISCEDDPIPYYADIEIINKTLVPIKLKALGKSSRVTEINIKSKEIYSKRILFENNTFLNINIFEIDSINITFDNKVYLGKKFNLSKPSDFDKKFILGQYFKNNKTKLLPLNKKYKVYKQIFELEINQSDYESAVPIVK